MTRRRSIVRQLAVGATFVLAATLTPGSALSSQPPTRQPDEEARTDATYFNNAAFNAADPYVLFDKPSGYYYAYSTAGATRDAEGNAYHFGIYRSADLATWEHLPGGAIPADDPKRWGRDWFWAPEVYHNPRTGLYYFFYSAREGADLTEDHFGYADFEEPSKVGVAVSKSPAGPFLNISDKPIDYFPYDPDYHDVNLIMDETQKKPPATLEEGQTAPKGTYIPFIDPNVYFDQGRVYLYYSRNAYRNWVWDHDLGKYIEESNIYAVELTAAWWNDPTGTTMPSIAPRFVDANRDADDPAGVRRDGFVPILDYGSDKQAWENAHVDDYAQTGGAKKDRRWEEGSTTFKRRVDTDGDGRKEDVYYLTYSANNWENEFYGVGYATAPSPLGPWRKYDGNPILAKDPALPMFSTGHGSLAWSPDGRESYYVHHGRPSSTGGPRKLYTTRLFMSGHGVDDRGAPVLVTDQTTSDRPVPSGVAPYVLSASEHSVVLRRGTSTEVTYRVANAHGAGLALGNPLNRVDVSVDRPDVVDLEVRDEGTVLTGAQPGHATLTLTYQRQTADGAYVDVANIRDGRRRSVDVTIPVTVR